MQINYIPSSTFKKIHKSSARAVFVMGPFNSGKSTGCILHAFLRAMNQPPNAEGVRQWKHLVIRKTAPSLRQTTIPSWQQWFKNAIIMNFSPSSLSGRINLPMDDGTTLDFHVEFLAIEDDKAVRKLKSLEVSSIHINEADEISRSTFEVARGRINRFPPKREGGTKNPFIILDYNGVPTDHWLYKVMEEEELPSNWEVYKQPPAVLKEEDTSGKVKYIINPEAENLEYLNDGYYEDLLNSSEDFIRVNLMNQYGEVRRGKPVYKDYIDNVHAVTFNETDDTQFKPQSSTPVIIGVDPGLTPAAAFTQRLWDGTIVTFDEITTEDCTIEEFIDDYLYPALAKHKCINNYKIILDPAATHRTNLRGESPYQFFRNKGLKVSTAKTQDPIRRINAVSRQLREKGKFKLSTECKALRKGFISDYRYANSNIIDGIVKEPRPEKNLYSHVHDALQYAMLEYDTTFGQRNTTGSKINIPRRKHRVASSIGGY